MSDSLPATRMDAIRTFFRHDSPRILFWTAFAFSAVRIYLGAWSWWDLVAAGAVVAIWPILEWCIHVFLLHWRPKQVGGRTLDLKVASKHRYHHAEPWDLDVVFVPMQTFLYAPIAIGLVYWWAPVPIATTLFATYFALSLHYEWCHYLAHIHWCPENAYYQRRVRKHRLHHFQHERMWWGVSTGIGDEIMGTDPESQGIARSPTTHDLAASWRRSM